MQTLKALLQVGTTYVIFARRTMLNHNEPLIPAEKDIA